MKTHILFTLLTICVTSTVVAQQFQELNFKETTHNFDVVKEQDGPITHEFLFTNTSTTPIQILGVKASCGCTTPGWSKEAIEPGATGFIKAQYNPLNRPGPFNKSLTVTTSGEQNRIVLYIKGQVTPKPRTLEDDFPALVGNTRFKSNSLNLGRVFDNGPAEKTYEIYNAGEADITFGLVEQPDYIKITISPEVLAPKQKADLKIWYDAAARNDLGFVQDNIAITTTDSDIPVKRFNVYATLQEYFPPMSSEDLAVAPKLTFEEHIKDFGKITEGQSATLDFMFTNEGKSTLVIRKTKASCACTVLVADKTELAPGESSVMKVTFNSTARLGNQQKSVTIFSNDPKAPSQRISVKGVVHKRSN